MKLNHLVAQIIAAPNFDHFSAVEVRSAYLALSDDKTIDPDAARRFVYTELLKLVRNGWLIKSTSVKKKITYYNKTELFDLAAINTRRNKVDSKIKVTPVESNNSLIDTLTERLNHYKNDLLTGLGEIDEYKLLYNKFPELHSKLQPKYDEVREQNSKLLGNIKAVESLISNK